MTFLQMISFALLFLIIGPCSFYFGELFGMSPFYIAVSIGLFLAVLQTMFNRYLNNNEYPLCQRGKCKSKDYTITIITEPQQIKGWRARCKCGHEYRIYGNEFFEITTNGDERIYKVRNHWFSKWVDPSVADRKE